MSQDQVRAAIGTDFGVRPEDIKAETNVSEQTQILTARVPDVLPGGGVADVAYVFGYKTNQLIQVSVAWSKTSDPSITPDRLFSDGNILRGHFLQAGYKPDTVVSNASVDNGLVMFRGEDAVGHSTVLLLQGNTTTNDTQRQLSPTALILFYLADAKNPDVFKLAPGSF